MKDLLSKLVAKLLTKRVVYWVLVQTWSKISTEKGWSNKHFEEITVMDVLKVLEKKFNR